MGFMRYGFAHFKTRNFEIFKIKKNKEKQILLS